MFLFPLIYLSSFLIALKQLLQRNKQGIFIFLIFGLPIYTTSLAIALQSGVEKLIPVMQPFKELLILILLGISIWDLKGKVKFLIIDYLILAYLVYTLLYVFLPIGQYDLGSKIVALKSASFFVFIYGAGRFIHMGEIYLSKYFHFILATAIAACVVLLFEVLTDQHFQSLTGYSDFNYTYFNQSPEGNYGLTWTFETSSGLKRFSSFFANPLEFGAATLLALAVIMGLYTTNDNKFRPDTFGILAIIATQLSIFLSISRASLVSYFIIAYVYTWVAKKKDLRNAIHLLGVLVIIYISFFLIFVLPDLYQFIFETIAFTNPSSVGHLLAWIEGIEAIINNPLGLGLGESGRVGIAEGENVGGENQLIIIGVQTGIVTLMLYLVMHIYFIRKCWTWYPKLVGKEKKVCLSLLLIKIGIIIPLLTSELETSAYISYLSWFLSGLFVNIISANATAK